MGGSISQEGKNKKVQADTVRRGKLFCGLGATLGLLTAVALF